MMKLKAANESAKIPTTGTEAEKFAGKWTNSKVGQVKFGGWDSEAYDQFEDNKKWIVDFRKNDQANGYAAFTYFKDAIRDKNGITGDTPGQKTKKSKGRKRKAKQPVDKSKRKISRIDE